MQQSYLHFLATQAADRVVEALSLRQHLFPHQPLVAAVQSAGEKVGFCPEAGQLAIQTLQIDPNLSIGRLRRSQLIQLSRTIHRHWRQIVSQTAPHSQPA